MADALRSLEDVEFKSVMSPSRSFIICEICTSVSNSVFGASVFNSVWLIADAVNSRTTLSRNEFRSGVSSATMSAVTFLAAASTIASLQHRNSLAFLVFV